MKYGTECLGTKPKCMTMQADLLRNLLAEMYIVDIFQLLTIFAHSLKVVVI